jgi:short-subunit dehydrogenase
METNFYGSVSLTMHALPFIRKQKGQIVAVNSISGLVGLPFRAHYCASKFALRGFFNSLAEEEPLINFMNVYPQQMTGTEFRNQQLVGKQEPEKPDWKYIAVEDMADMIITAVDRRANVMMEEKTFIVIGTYKLFPWVFGRSMRKEIELRNKKMAPIAKL